MFELDIEGAGGCNIFNTLVRGDMLPIHYNLIDLKLSK